MLEVTKAGLYPMVTAVVQITETLVNDTLDAKVDVTFAGKKHTYDRIQVKTKLNGQQAITTGRLPIMLSNFDVERPSLLGIKIDNSTPVDFELKWN